MKSIRSCLTHFSRKNCERNVQLALQCLLVAEGVVSGGGAVIWGKNFFQIFRLKSDPFKYLRWFPTI